MHSNLFFTGQLLARPPNSVAVADFLTVQFVYCAPECDRRRKGGLFEMSTAAIRLLAANVALIRRDSLAATRAFHVVHPGFSTMDGESDAKSLSTKRPISTPSASAVRRRHVAATPTKPEWRGRRNSDCPGRKTTLKGAMLSMISDATSV